MILFDVGEELNRLNRGIINFLEQNKDSPIFWSLIVIAIFEIAWSVIQYLTRK